MAYLPVDEEEQKKQAGAGGDHPLLAGFGGSSSPAPAGGAQAPTVQQPSSGFVPYSAYANANQGSAAKMASGLAGDIDKSAGDAQLGVANERNKFVDQVHAGSPYYKSPAEGLASWQGGLTQQQAPAEAPKTKAAYEPTPQAPKAGAGSTYTGPTDFSLSQGARDASTKAAEQLSNSGDDYGRQALLQKKFGSNGGYTQGESRLDAALTGGAGGGQFDALKAKYGDLVGQMGQAEVGANQVAGSAKGMTDATTKANAAQAAWNKYGLNKPFDPNAPKPLGPDATPLERYHAEHPDSELAKPQNYDQYMKANAKDWIRGIGQDTDVGGHLLDALGLPNVNDTVTNLFESGNGPYIGALGKVGDPSNRAIDAFNGIPNKDTARAVYDSMSQSEVAALEKMPRRARDEWIRNRANQLGLDPG